MKRIPGFLFAALWAAGFSFFLGCQEPLVREEYGVFNLKSINGVDAMLGLLEGEGRKVVRSPYLTDKIMETADVIVYFSRGREDTEDLARLEAWLHGVPYRPPPEVLEAQEAARFPRPALPGDPDQPTPIQSEDADETEELHGDEADETEPMETETDDYDDEESSEAEKDETLAEEEAEAETAEEDEESEAEESEQSKQLEELQPPRRENPVTLLYFARDTDASVPFWDSLRRQMEGHPREEKFSQEMLEARLNERKAFPEHREMFLGNRKLLDETGRPLQGLWVHPLLRSGTLPDFPVRFVPEPPRSHYEQVDLPFRTLVETRQGYDLIREFLLVRGGRVILSYNSEWALNYSLVRGPYRKLARSLIQYTVSRHTAADPLKIFWITRSLQPVTEVQNEETSILRPFTVFPLNVVLFQMLFLLILFLVARWPHERRPREEATRGKREFLEHIRFLGMKLRRSKNPFDSLEPLGAYVKRNRFDSPRWENAIAGLFSKGGEDAAEASAPAPKENPDSPNQHSREEKQ